MVLAELTAVFRFIARNPQIGHTRTDLTGRTVLFGPVFLHSIGYRPEASPIYIVAVIHAARDVAGRLAGLEM